MGGIWVARDLAHFIERDHPEFWGDHVEINGRTFKRLSPVMFAALRVEMRSRAAQGLITQEEVVRFTAIEQSIATLGLKEEFRGS